MNNVYGFHWLSFPIWKKKHYVKSGKHDPRDFGYSLCLVAPPRFNWHQAYDDQPKCKTCERLLKKINSERPTHEPT